MTMPDKNNLVPKYAVRICLFVCFLSFFSLFLSLLVFIICYCDRKVSLLNENTINDLEVTYQRRGVRVLHQTFQTLRNLMKVLLFPVKAGYVVIGKTSHKDLTRE